MPSQWPQRVPNPRAQVALTSLDLAASTYPSVDENIAETELREILRGTGVPEGAALFYLI